MLTINTQKTSFMGGVNVEKGGIKYVCLENGSAAAQKLEEAKKEFAKCRWTLHVSENGYSIESSTGKIYTGPFSVKRLYKSGSNRESASKMSVKMDGKTRSRYVFEFPNRTELNIAYRKIQQAKGLDKMLLIFALFKKRI